MIVTRAISLTNLLVATSALSFQAFVLYPWHNDLDAGFEDLKKAELKLLDTLRSGLDEQQRKAFSEKLNELKSQSKKSLHFVAAHAPSPSESIAAVRSQIFPVKDKESASDMSLYARYALAGAFCCSFTHAVLTPVDVVKTRIQLDPATYSSNILKSTRHIVSSEGPSALLTGLGATVAGYCLQGAFKFGGYEFFKSRAIDYLGHSTAADHRNAVYLASAGAAEFLGDIALCPFESVRIRLVSQPSYANGCVSGLARIAREEGVGALYSGLGPILLKQIPYTMATFLVYEKAIQTAYSVVDKKDLPSLGVTGINLGAGLISGLAAAVVSQPADTILSKINKEKASTGEGTARRIFRIARELGVRGAYTGMQARAVMVGGMTAVQFGIYGDVKKLFGATDGVELTRRVPVARTQELQVIGEPLVE